MDFCLNCGCWWNRVFLCQHHASYSGSGVCFSLFSRLFVFHPSWRIVVLLCRPPPRCDHISITHIPAYVGPSSEYVRTCEYNTLPECRLASPKTDSAVPTALLTERTRSTSAAGAGRLTEDHKKQMMAGGFRTIVRTAGIIRFL